jgi:glycosyltransferase involved in cell wall biosynthesis
MISKKLKNGPHYEPHTNLWRGKVVYAQDILQIYTHVEVPWQKVSIIIPAFNEAVTVGTVVRTALSVEPYEVLVVDNNSADSTAEIAAKSGAKVESCLTQGKAEAMITGVKATHDATEVIMFLDADLLGLQINHLKALAAPFFAKSQNPSNIMTLGTFDRGTDINKIYWYGLPALTGQRGVLKSEFLRVIDTHQIKGWEIEATLNAHYRDHKLPMLPMILDSLFHRPKNEKLTNRHIGNYERVKMLAIATFSYVKYPLRKLKRLIYSK